jgi:hypothetical protein
MNFTKNLLNKPSIFIPLTVDIGNYILDKTNNTTTNTTAKKYKIKMSYNPSYECKKYIPFGYENYILNDTNNKYKVTKLNNIYTDIKYVKYIATKNTLYNIIKNNNEGFFNNFIIKSHVMKVITDYNQLNTITEKYIIINNTNWSVFIEIIDNTDTTFLIFDTNKSMQYNMIFADFEIECLVNNVMRK